jgi:hypothetical protein
MLRRVKNSSIVGDDRREELSERIGRSLLRPELVNPSDVH